jgi:hypothetical protein
MDQEKFEEYLDECQEFKMKIADWLREPENKDTNSFVVVSSMAILIGNLLSVMDMTPTPQIEDEMIFDMITANRYELGHKAVYL